MRFLLLTAALAMIGCRQSNSASDSEAARLLAEVRSNGADSIAARMGRDDVFGEHVLDAIGSGDSTWLEVAVALRPTSYADIAESLPISVANALPKAPERVLSLIQRNAFTVDAVCTIPFIEPEDSVVRAYYANATAALGHVSRAEVAAERDRCQAALVSSRPPEAPATRPDIEAATLTRARQSIADYLQGSVVNARGDVPALDLCYQAPAFKETASLLAIARARILDVQPAASVRGPRADSLSVLAELLVVARGRRSADGWVVEKNTQLDTVRLTLVPATHVPAAEWALCWSGYASKDFTGTPVFLRLGDSTAIEGLEWKSPMHSWASLARLADSVRWSSLESLRNDTAVARTKVTGTFADRLGVLQSARDGQWCLTIADSTLPAGTPLLVVSPAMPQSAGPGLIESRRARACSTPGDEWGSVSMENASYYHVALAPGRSAADPAIVVAGQTTVLRSKAGVAADVDRDGALEMFESCTSSEGIHLRVSTGSGAGSIERWHQYFYVPYTLEPTCKP